MHPYIHLCVHTMYCVLVCVCMPVNVQMCMCMYMLYVYTFVYVYVITRTCKNKRISNLTQASRKQPQTNNHTTMHTEQYKLKLALIHQVRKSDVAKIVQLVNDYL